MHLVFKGTRYQIVCLSQIKSINTVAYFHQKSMHFCFLRVNKSGDSFSLNFELTYSDN